MENNKLKIVHLCLSSFYIDNYSYQENLLPKFHMKLGHDVTVVASLVSFDNNGIPCLLSSSGEYFSKEGYKVIRLDYKRPNYKFNKFVRIYGNLMRVLKKENPDVIFIHDFSFMDILKVMRFAKKNRLKVYIDCHTDYINSARSWVSKYIFHQTIWRCIGKKIAPYVQMFYGVTPLRCSFLREAYKIPEDKIQLLPLGIDDEVFQQKLSQDINGQLRQKYGLEKNNFVIVTGGKIDILKNIHLVLEAFRKLNAPGAKLVVFGVVAPDIRGYIERLFKSPNIIFVGWLSPDEILNFFIMADLVIFPGTHSVLWEQAAGTGTPVIYKYWPEMTHVDIGGNCVFLMEDSIEEIEFRLKQMIMEPATYNRMKSIAQEKGLSSFAYSEIARRSIAN
ncbi:MAG: hypothetical protein BGN92_07935 [Sphingobacteriales bacterium 41-5]|nr:MAG: hypothetical protein BGN92_07935 [Sphingobacteriales bacterium 41-5]